jgi:hypothetical protein
VDQVPNAEAFSSEREAVLASKLQHLFHELVALLFLPTSWLSLSQRFKGTDDDLLRGVVATGAKLLLD